MNVFDVNEFKQNAYKAIDWIAQYFENIEQYNVKSTVNPGDIKNKIPEFPPSESHEFDLIVDDFKKIIVPGMTHWQSPNFFAYFPANSSFPSILAEMFTAALGAQCMKWDTSPAAAELEEQMMNWLKQMTGLPGSFHGVIQDTASTATLCAILTAREKFTNGSINNDGFENKKFRVYCSSEAHSSVEKAVKIAGIGKKNLVKIAVDENFAMIPSELKKAIDADLKHGFIPLCVVAAFGTTGSTAIDPIEAISEITSKHQLWLHVDAAFGGSALILPEIRPLAKGIDRADSLVFNPHKWLFTNFDCSAYFVKDKEALINTFQIIPEYLKTKTAGLVHDYCDWGIQLGRRFRALKLWFVIRSFGVDGLQKRIREQLQLTGSLVKLLKHSGKFEILAPVPFTLVCFQYVPDKNLSLEKINELNETLLHRLNSTGKIYISHTKLNGRYALRLQASQTFVQERHIESAFQLMEKTASEL
ncbi:MAG: aspartate aminotransferase family protein [Bacteroidales bacterium]|nr:aspartate aminotransferase family protein [Bacteroidales bacterium]